MRPSTSPGTGTIGVWYPAEPPPLASDSFLDAGTAAVPAACGVPAKYGRTATELVEQTTRLDIVFGEYETTQRTAYVASPYGLICQVVSDDLKTYYDYNAFALESKPLTETVVKRNAGAAASEACEAGGVRRDERRAPARRSRTRDESGGASGERTRHRPRTYPRKEHQMKRATLTALATAALLSGCSENAPRDGAGIDGILAVLRAARR